MKSILEISREKKIISEHNSIINNSVVTEFKEDRVIRILTKEVADYFLRLFADDEKHK